MDLTLAFHMGSCGVLIGTLCWVWYEIRFERRRWEIEKARMMVERGVAGCICGKGKKFPSFFCDACFWDEMKGL
jgi:hypothetical protein